MMIKTKKLQLLKKLRASTRKIEKNDSFLMGDSVRYIRLMRRMNTLMKKSNTSSAAIIEMVHYIAHKDMETIIKPINRRLDKLEESI